MCRGQRLGLDVPLVDREVGLKATSLYLVLLAIPGSSAFKIFHPVLFNKALDSFKLALKLHLLSGSSKKRSVGRKKSSQSSSSLSQQSRKGAGRRRRPSSPSSNVRQFCSGAFICSFLAHSLAFGNHNFQLDAKVGLNVTFLPPTGWR